MLATDDTLRWVVTRFAEFRRDHGEVVDAPDLVEPTPDYFPDEVKLEPAGIATILRRVLSYAPVGDDLPLALSFVEPEAKEGGKSCSSGACGTGPSGAPMGGVRREGALYHVVLSASDVGNPILLTTALARSAGSIVLFEADEDLPEASFETESELAATHVGLGLLLLCGASIYKKGCGGLKQHQGTHLGVDALAAATALFVCVHGKKPGLLRKHLEITQREAFDEAMAWATRNEALIESLRADPASVAAGFFELHGKTSILDRLFRRGRQEPAQVAVPQRARSEEEARRIAEAKALVDDVL